MPVSDLKLIKRCAEWRPKNEYKEVPAGTRGIYTLLKRRRERGKERFDVVYIGLSAGTRQGVRRRLRSHANSTRKSKLWDHFSLFEVWDNITEAEIKELEGLFRHIYRKDSQANRINKHKAYRKLYKIRVNRIKEWKSN